MVPMHLIEWISDGCANNEITSQKPFALKVGLDDGDSFHSRFPESLELAAEQTLLKLDEEVLQCLEYAGILGKEFDASHLALAMAKEQPHILGLLEKAEQTGVITDLVLKDDLFAFTSNVYVSVLYNRMLRMEAKPGQRIRAYNKIFTDLFETEFEANGSDKSLFRAANHAQESGEKYQSKAMVLCEKACRRAYAVHAYSEAVAYARHILQLPIDKEHNSPTRRAYLRALVFRAEKITARNPKEREGHLNESLHEWKLNIKGNSEADAEAELLNQIALCQSDLGMFKKAIKSANLSLNLHKISLHEKYTIIFACILLFLIGAPLGSIIRKGGLGLPLVLSIIIFLSYHYIGIFAKNAAEDNSVSPIIASWVSTIILSPFAYILTKRASSDKGNVNLDFIIVPFNSFYNKLIRGNNQNL